MMLKRLLSLFGFQREVRQSASPEHASVALPPTPSAVDQGQTGEAFDLRYLPRRSSYPLLRDGLTILAEILFRLGGPGTHEWFEVTASSLHGEHGKSGWALVREIGLRDSGGERFITVDRLIVLRDPQTRLDYHEIPEIARFLRLMAGGLNARDAAELEAFRQERDGAIRTRRWLDEAGARRSRTVEPPIPVLLQCQGELEGVAIRIRGLVTYGGKPWVIEGQVRHPGSRRWKDETFSLPGYCEPSREILSLTPDGATAPVPDVSAWLDTATRKRKKAPPST